MPPDGPSPSIETAAEPAVPVGVYYSPVSVASNASLPTSDSGKVIPAKRRASLLGACRSARLTCAVAIGAILLGGNRLRMRVSVIIPAFNAAAFVCRSLDSLLRQTRPADEVIVSDDGSADGTAAIVENWSAQSGIAVRIVSGPNGGIAAARNRALRVSVGDAISILDADDEMLPRQIEALLEGLHRFPDAALACGDVTIRYDDGSGEPANTSATLGKWTRPTAIEPWRVVEDPFVANLAANLIPNQCTMFRRSALEACGSWDDAFRAVEDRDLFLRLAGHGAFYFRPEVLAYKHERAGGVSRNVFRMSAYQYRALNKAFGYPNRRDLVLPHLRKAIGSYVYHSSKQGLGEYRLALREMAGGEVRPQLIDVSKGWLRALYFGSMGRK